MRARTRIRIYQETRNTRALHCVLVFMISMTSPTPYATPMQVNKSLRKQGINQTASFGNCTSDQTILSFKLIVIYKLSSSMTLIVLRRSLQRPLALRQDATQSMKRKQGALVTCDSVTRTVCHNKILQRREGSGYHKCVKIMR